MIKSLNDLAETQMLNFSEKLSAHLLNELLRLQSHLNSLHAKTVISIGCFSPQAFEPRWYLQSGIANLKNVEWHLPIYSQTQMKFVNIGNDFSKISQWGIGLVDQAKFDQSSHDEKLDVMIVPGVAFDRCLMRVGRGKGYFDRYFANHASEIIKIGVCFDMQLVDQIEADDHDVAMDIVVTDQKIYRAI
jgi:5,10-methenyltetrahydrofolate synthetase